MEEIKILMIYMLTAIGVVMNYQVLRYNEEEKGSKRKERIRESVIFWGIIGINVYISMNKGIYYLIQGYIGSYLYTQAINDVRERLVDKELNEKTSIIVGMIPAIVGIGKEGMVSIGVLMIIIYICEKMGAIGSGDSKGLIIIGYISILLICEVSIIYYLGYIVIMNIYTVIYGVSEKRMKGNALYPGMLYSFLILERIGI